MLPMEVSKISSSFRSQRRPNIAPVSAESRWAFLLWWLLELFCFKRQSLWVVSLSRGWMLTRTGFHCGEGATHLLPRGNLKSKLQDTFCTLKSCSSTSWICTEMQPHDWKCVAQLIYNWEQQLGVLNHRLRTAESYERRGGITSICWLIKSEAAVGT